MSATMWIDTDADRTIELGGTIKMYKTFQELAEVAGPTFAEDYPQLFGVPSQTEDTADADPDWLLQVGVQAEAFLKEHDDELTDDARTMLQLLQEM